MPESKEKNKVHDSLFSVHLKKVISICQALFSSGTLTSIVLVFFFVAVRRYMYTLILIYLFFFYYLLHRSLNLDSGSFK